MARVLLIDDDRRLREMLCRMLAGEGHAIIEADNGSSGLVRLREQPADLVITDILMPEQEGLETIIVIRRDFPNVKIIAISGGGSQSHMINNYLSYAKTFGANYALAKPFTLWELLEAVRRTLSEDDQALNNLSSDTLDPVAH